MQIHEEVQKFTAGTEISGASLIGGADIKRQVEKLKKTPKSDCRFTGTYFRINSYEKAKNA